MKLMILWCGVNKKAERWIYDFMFCGCTRTLNTKSDQLLCIRVFILRLSVSQYFYSNKYVSKNRSLLPIFVHFMFRCFNLALNTKATLQSIVRCWNCELSSCTLLLCLSNLSTFDNIYVAGALAAMLHNVNSGRIL